MNPAIEAENPLAHYDEIMEWARNEENKGKVPHILVSEPRIGRNTESMLQKGIIPFSVTLSLSSAGLLIFLM